LHEPTNLIAPTQEDIVAANKLLASERIVGPNLVAIFPGSGDRAKNWPVNNFVALAKRLSAEFDATPIIILGPAEQAMRADFRDRDLIVVEDSDLGTVAALAQMASCFVGNDSGVSHLAASVGARGVVIFGPTDPVRWRPLGRVKILHHNPLEQLEVSEVFIAVASTLA
jgi:ADP-heptose:LPS heptosyltransferase